MDILSEWSFGWTEIIGLFSVIVTATAVIVSLYLATRSNVTKVNLELINHGCGLFISNVGKIRVTITEFGIQTKNNYYVNKNEKFIKLTVPKMIGNTQYSFDSTFGYVVLDPGEVVSVKISEDAKKILMENKTDFGYFINVNNKLITKVIKYSKFDSDYILQKDIYKYKKLTKKQVMNHSVYFE